MFNNLRQFKIKEQNAVKTNTYNIYDLSLESSDTPVLTARYFNSYYYYNLLLFAL